MTRLLLSICLTLFAAGMVFAQTDAPSVKTTDAAAQLQALEIETAAHIRTLEEQRASVDPQTAEAIERQIADTKILAEVQRLQILLAQAESEGDDARALEIRNALQHWLNPPVVPTSTVDRPAPTAPGVVPQTPDNHR